MCDARARRSGHESVVTLKRPHDLDGAGISADVQEFACVCGRVSVTSRDMFWYERRSCQEQ